nr:PREDICTED: embryonic polarity protein dorsal-like isoform X2 [Linepithema humile]
MDEAQYINQIYTVMEQCNDPVPTATIAMNGKHVQQYVQILEQPTSKFRFRYESEGPAGSIPGVNYTSRNKIYPSIRIVGCKGCAMVLVSCVTKDAPYRPHPHNLINKKVCQQGVCTVEVPAGNMVVTFSNLSIQCVTRMGIKNALKERQELRVDPFGTGFKHPNNIDLSVVRLCFQVFLEGSQKGKFNKPLQPIVSDPIYNSRTVMPDLVICKLSHCSASVAGGLDMVLLCDKVVKEDIKVIFFEKRDEKLIWKGFGNVQYVHRQVAIAFKTPKYHSREVVIRPVQIYIQLQRPSDNATSEPRPFQMLPLGSAYSPDRLLPIGGPSTSAESSFLRLENSEFGLQTLRPRASPERTPSPMDVDWSNFCTLSPIQQQHQSIIHPMMPQPNTPATTHLQSIEYVSDQSHQLERNLTRVTPENRAVELGNIFGSAEISDILDDFDVNVNSADLTDFEANLSANLSGLSISISV